jgi:pilus assembly protein Flp/PilA
MSTLTAAALKRVSDFHLRVQSEDGQDLLEYGLLVALIALVAIGAVATLGNTITAVFWDLIAGAF